jgi:hypothetical protein
VAFILIGPYFAGCNFIDGKVVDYFEEQYIIAENTLDGI